MDGSIDGIQFMYVLKWKHGLATLLPSTQYAKSFINLFSDFII